MIETQQLQHFNQCVFLIYLFNSTAHFCCSNAVHVEGLRPVKYRLFKSLCFGTLLCECTRLSCGQRIIIICTWRKYDCFVCWKAWGAVSWEPCSNLLYSGFVLICVEWCWTGTFLEREDRMELDYFIFLQRKRPLTCNKNVCNIP